MIQVQTKLVVLKWNGAMIFEIRKPRHVVKKKKKKKKKNSLSPCAKISLSCTYIIKNPIVDTK